MAHSNLRTPAWATALFGITTMDEAAMRVIRDASPSHHIVAGLPPFLLVHGANDTRVAVEQSRQFQSKLQARGNPCDLLVVPGVGHGMVTGKRGTRATKPHSSSGCGRRCGERGARGVSFDRIDRMLKEISGLADPLLFGLDAGMSEVRRFEMLKVARSIPRCPNWLIGLYIACGVGVFKGA